MLKVWDILNWQKIKHVIIRYNIYFFVYKIFFIISTILLLIILIYINNILFYFFWIIFFEIFILIYYYLLIEKELWVVYITENWFCFLEKKSILKRKFTQISYSEVNQIKVLKSWFFQNKFNYGSMKIFFYDRNILDINLIPDVMNFTNKLFKKN